MNIFKMLVLAALIIPYSFGMTELDQQLALEIVFNYNTNITRIQQLINQGANVNFVNPHYMGGTALHMAVVFNLPEVVQVLLETGAHVNALNYLDRTPLHLSAKNTGYTPIIKALLTYGADIHIRDKNNCTALDIAVSTAINSDNVETVKLLIGAGAHLTEQLLTHAIQLNSIPLARLMLHYGIVPTKANLELIKTKHNQAVQNQWLKYNCASIGRMLISHIGLHAKQSRIARESLAQVLPSETACHIASYLPKYATHYVDTPNADAQNQ